MTSTALIAEHESWWLIFTFNTFFRIQFWDSFDKEEQTKTIILDRREIPS